MHAFQEFSGFIPGCIFSSQGNFYHLVEPYRFDGGKDLSGSSVELAVDSRGRDGHDLLVRVGDALVHVDHLGAFHDSTIGTGLHTFSAIYTFVLVNMLGSVFPFRDGLYRANILARYGGEHDRVVRTNLGTQPATHAIFLRDASFSSLERNSRFRAVHQTRTSLTTATHVGYEILGLHASTTSLVHHGKDVFFRVLVVKCFLCKLGQRDQVDFLVCDLET